MPLSVFDLDLSLALCICPGEIVDKITEKVLNENVALCVDRLPSIKGFYSWLDDYELDNQVILLITVLDDLSEELYTAILSLNPQEIPVIVMMGIDQSYPQYIKWLVDSSQGIESEAEDENQQPIETEEQNETEKTESKDIAGLQQELKSNKQKLTELRTQLKKVEERIKQARKTNIFGRKQSGENERQRDKLAQEIKDIKDTIAAQESEIKALEE